MSMPHLVHRPHTCAIFVALLLLVGLAPPAHADFCTGCRKPSVAEVLQRTGATLELRGDDGTWFPKSRDYMEMDAGACELRVSDPDPAALIASKLEYRAGGEVWNCPDSKSDSSISAKIAESDRSEWSEQTTGSIGLKAGPLSFGVAIIKRRGGSHGITETSDLSQTIEAKPCQRVPWLAYLQVSTFQVEVHVTVVQHYVWWTKNSNTDAKVHQKGSFEQSCFAGQTSMRRKAPTMWYIRRMRLSCDGCTGGSTADLGWAPPLPTPAPELPPGIWWPDPERDDDHEPRRLHPDLGPEPRDDH